MEALHSRCLLIKQKASHDNLQIYHLTRGMLGQLTQLFLKQTPIYVRPAIGVLCAQDLSQSIVGPPHDPSHSASLSLSDLVLFCSSHLCLEHSGLCCSLNTACLFLKGSEPVVFRCGQTAFFSEAIANILCVITTITDLSTYHSLSNLA